MSQMFNPPHPGEVLRDYLPETISVTDAASRLGVTRQALSAIINGRAGISAEMAMRLSRALGTCGRFNKNRCLRCRSWQLNSAINARESATILVDATTNSVPTSAQPSEYSSLCVWRSPRLGRGRFCQPQNTAIADVRSKSPRPMLLATWRRNR
jgi:addiction module HigA family antidote